MSSEIELQKLLDRFDDLEKRLARPVIDLECRLTLRLFEVAAVTGWSSQAVLDEFRAGRFPPPVNPEVHARLFVWSVAELVRWADPRGVHVDGDPTPPGGLVRPSLGVVS